MQIITTIRKNAQHLNKSGRRKVEKGPFPHFTGKNKRGKLFSKKRNVVGIECHGNKFLWEKKSQKLRDFYRNS